MEQVATMQYISSNELFCNFIDEFLEPFEYLIKTDIHRGMVLNFDIYHKSTIKKLSPILILARPRDAKKITEIYKELYNGTYPYKEMEHEKSVRKMIDNLNYRWVLFKDRFNNVAGCITFALDFKNKRGYIRGFMLRKKYQGHIDIVKSMIGSMIGMCSMFRDKIFMWYVENRTAHAKSQYAMWVCGINPIAFFPNKDIFFNSVESDLMQIIYDKRALNEYHRMDKPCIIPEVHKSYLYSKSRYNLSPVKIINPKLDLDPRKLNSLYKKITKKTVKDKFGYETITLSIKDSNSYIQFIYTPTVQTFEKTKYKVKNLEELYVLVHELKKFGSELNIRYYEVFVSAYEPNHQKIFLDAGLSPRGYIPSWNYNQKRKYFEDYILFNYFEGKIDENIQLIPEGIELLKSLNFLNK